MKSTIKLTPTEQHVDHDKGLAQSARFLGLLGLCLPALFVVSVLVVMLPLRILDPGWQLRLIAILVERGPLALLGVAMSYISTVMDPGDVKLRARRNALVRFTKLAVIGYLLVIPLQLSAVWRSTVVLSQQQNSKVSHAQQNLKLMRQQIEVATSFNDIQTRLAAIQAPNLPIESATLFKPLPQIKAALLSEVDQAERMIERQSEASNRPVRLWGLLQSSFATVLAASIEALAFSAASPRRPMTSRLWRYWQQWSKANKKRMQKMKRQKRLPIPFW
jgi:hypothetical protein